MWRCVCAQAHSHPSISIEYVHTKTRSTQCSCATRYKGLNNKLISNEQRCNLRIQNRQNNNSKNKKLFHRESSSFTRTNQFWCVCCFMHISADNIDLFDEFRVKFIYMILLPLLSGFVWLLLNLFLWTFSSLLIQFYLRGAIDN